MVNTNEVWSFKVRVFNYGNLNMTGVSLHIHGLNGIMLSTSSTEPWTLPDITTLSILLGWLIANPTHT
jgi:hypothetical protein